MHSLRGQVFAKLEEAIINGEIKPGESLIELKISDEFGVSRTPVREAIRQLELEGLVTTAPNKGAIVIGVSEQDIKDIFKIRILTEGLAARWAAEKITQEELENLKEIIELSEFYTNKNDMRRLRELDSQFHELIYQACKSRPLRHVLSNFHHYIQNARGESYKTPGRAKKSLDEHKAIYEAMANNDGNMAEKLISKHVKNAKENYYAKWENATFKNL